MSERDSEWDECGNCGHPRYAHHVQGRNRCGWCSTTHGVFCEGFVEPTKRTLPHPQEDTRNG